MGRFPKSAVGKTHPTRAPFSGVFWTGVDLGYVKDLKK
jgi:hypothetical protein